MEYLNKSLFKFTDQFSSTKYFAQDILSYFFSELPALTEHSKQ